MPFIELQLLIFYRIRFLFVILLDHKELHIFDDIRAKTGINEVALSGGVWQNQMLLDLSRAALHHENFIVYTHQQTPANDGGLALGQAVIANHQ